jgi:hypothetical protein
MLIFDKGLIRSVLEYECIAFDRMAGTHMLKLERVQYRCLRIALGLMQSTLVQTLQVIGGVPPLRMRFLMLNHGYLISAFSTAGHTLRHELAALSGLNSPKIVREFNVVESYNLEPARSVYEYPLGALLHVPKVNDEVERELSYISRDCYQTVVPCLVASKSSRFESSVVLFTDGSNGEISSRLREPSSVFTSELLAIFMALVQIRVHHNGPWTLIGI